MARIEEEIRNYQGERTVSMFKLKLEKTYYNQGFFNITVDYEQYIRPNSGSIQLLLGANRVEIQGDVNREANQNGTPRIMGRTNLRNWFQANFSLGEVMDVKIISPEKLHLAPEN